MKSLDKKQQTSVAPSLKALLMERFAKLQQHISSELENLQDIVVQNIETSFEKYSAGNEEVHKQWAHASLEKDTVTVASSNDKVVPLRPETVPRPLPQSMPEELQIVEMDDAPLPCEIHDAPPLCEIQNNVALSIVPTSVLQVEPPAAEFGSTCSDIASEVTPPPQTPWQTSELASNSEPTEIRASRQGRVSKAVHDWKSTLPLWTTEEDETHAFIHLVKDTVFADPATMKDSIRSEILHPSIRISAMYKEASLATRIAKSEWFEIMTTFVIILNALWLAVDLDLNDSTTLIHSDAIFVVMENFFCSYFFVELLIILFAFKRKRDCLKDHWFLSDTILVLLMIIEVWILTVLFWILEMDHEDIGNYGNASVLRLFRIVRLSKIGRLAKVLHALPELVTLVRGIKFAARTVFFCLCLVICVIYVSALVFRELTYGLPIGDKYFPSVPASMATLLFKGAMPDQESFIEDVSEGQIIVGVLVVFFIFLTTFTLMNMIVGVLVAVVGEIAEAEKERRTIAFVKHELYNVFSSPEIDLDFNNKISEDEFESFLTHPVSIKCLTSVGVDVIGLVDVSEFIFKMDGDGGLSFSDLLELVLNFRGSNTATVKDIVDLRMFLTTQYRQMEARIEGYFEKSKGTAGRMPSKRISACS